MLHQPAIIVEQNIPRDRPVVYVVHHSSPAEREDTDVCTNYIADLFTYLMFDCPDMDQPDTRRNKVDLI